MFGEERQTELFSRELSVCLLASELEAPMKRAQKVSHVRHKKIALACMLAGLFMTSHAREQASIHFIANHTRTTRGVGKIMTRVILMFCSRIAVILFYTLSALSIA